MRLTSILFASALSLVTAALLGCGADDPQGAATDGTATTSTTTGGQGGSASVTTGSSAGGTSDVGTGGGADGGGVPDACGAVPASMCSPQNPGSVIRGIAHFDPSHFAPGATPKLVLFLNHRVTVAAAEATTGGHPHAYKVVDGVDPTSGSVAFSIDDCEFGVSMYSEDACAYNLIATLDENGSNDPFVVGQGALTVEAGELTAMTELTISCHAGSPCLDLTLDCTDGTACTTFDPLSVSDCHCTGFSCGSDSVICSN